MDDLKKRPVWVNWRFETDNGRPTKIPVNPHNGYGAKTNDPQTWGSFELVSQNLDEQKWGCSGIGFCFADNICGIDIDHCDMDGELAQSIISLMDGYTEYSPSGKGYHIIFRADKTKLAANHKDIFYSKNVKLGVECYIAGLTNRYFTYTGEAVNTLGIEDRTDQLLNFLEKYMRKKKENPPQPATVVPGESRTQQQYTTTADDILNIARRAKKGKDFIALYDNGDMSAYNNDHSSADLALCIRLAYYLGGNAGEVDRLFRESALYREKWEREEYRTATINKAIEGCGGKFFSHKSGQPIKQTAKVISKKIERPGWEGAIYINPFETEEYRRRYSLTDIGAGKLFADIYRNISRYVPEAKAWYVYDGRVWREDVGNMIVGRQAQDLTDYMMDCRKLISDDTMRETWSKFAIARMKKPARDTMLSDAAMQYPILITQFDKDPYLFNCQNCTLNLKDFTQHKHRANDLLSKMSNVNFEPDAQCERWERFISEVMCDDVEKAKFLQKALGYALTGDTSEECFFILYGAKTRNGKGTSMETTVHLMGDYGKTAQPETIGQKPSTHSGGATEDLARLKGARFVNMSEPDKGLQLNVALVKQLTGGDTVTARFLHQNSFEYKPEYKLFINTNHRPNVHDDSIFASDRVKLIPFERHFEADEQEKGLKEFFKRPENISGIFNWFIEGLKLYRQEGLVVPDSVAKATKDYREVSDTVGQFIKDNLEPFTGGKIKTDEIYQDYTTWCSRGGFNPKNKIHLIDDLRVREMVKRDCKMGNIVFGYRFIQTEAQKNISIIWNKNQG